MKMQRIQTEDFLRYRFISSLSAAPSGNAVVFCLSQANRETNSYDSLLWRFDMQSRQTEPVPGTEQVRSFCFLDQDTVLYPRINEEKDLEYVNAGGWLTVFNRRILTKTDAEELFRVPLKNASAFVVKDGLFLLSAVRDNTRPDIESMPESQRMEALKKLEEEKDFEVCEELPFVSDGKGFINRKRQALFLYDCVKGDLSPLTEPYFETGHFAVSQDGRYIAFSGVSYDRYYVRTHGIWLYDTEKRSVETLLTPGSYQIMALDFLEGELVVAASPWNGEGPYPNHNLYTIPLSGGKMTLRHIHSREDFGNKTCSDCRYGSNPNFRTKDGKLYYFTTCDTGSFLNCWQPGKEPVRLNDESVVPDGFALGEETIFVTGTADGLQELYSLEGDRAVCLTAINSVMLGDRMISVPRKLRFTDRDGFEVSGFVIEPVDYDPEKTYPGILEIHGGPRASFTGAFFHEMQVLAGKGYFVFYCNPRGSAGCGDAFADICGIRGTVDYNDLMEWTDLVLRTYPQIDPGRLGVMGGSYGGYMTNWIITHTKRFRAAVSMRSISNIVGDYGVTDFGVWGTPGVYGGTPWSHEEKLRDQSPYTYAMNVTTPTLFLHSFEDHRCTMSGAMQMYSVLQIKGVPTRMCLFRRSCHELSRSGLPRSRIRRLQEITSWVDRYLTQEPGTDGKE